jgi:hypothetical protein
MPGVWKRADGEGRSTPLLHSWFVQRSDGLILRTLSPNFGLTPKLQHYLLEVSPMLSEALLVSPQTVNSFAAGKKLLGTA